MAEITNNETGAPFPLPRVTIKFCTQCKWMLRAAYYAQELLSTFSTSLGEVALQPSTGGTFVVEIFHQQPPSATTTSSSVLWDRKTDGGFPETKELKRRVRDVIEPGRDLGHVDRHNGEAAFSEKPAVPAVPAAASPAGTGAQEQAGRPSGAGRPGAGGQQAGGGGGGGDPGPGEAAGDPQKGEREVCEDCN